MVLRFSPCLHQGTECRHVGEHGSVQRHAVLLRGRVHKRSHSRGTGTSETGAELVFFCELFTFVGGQRRTGPAALRQSTLGRVPPGPPGDLALQMAPYFLGEGGGGGGWGHTVGPKSAFGAFRRESFLSSSPLPQFLSPPLILALAPPRCPS